MPLFGLSRLGEVAFQLRQPHTAKRVLARLLKQRRVPLRLADRSSS